MTNFDFKNVEPFRHSPLSDPNVNIRVLKILPDGDHKPLRCTIECTDLTKHLVSIKYICLSYMWGTGDATHPILINDKSFMVRENLWDFLLQARKGWTLLRAKRDHRTETAIKVRKGWNPLAKEKFSNPGQAIWVDAICIDQQNDDEKSAQVKIMGKIFSTAFEVVSWLGRGGDKRVEIAFEFIAKHGGTKALESGKRSKREYLDAISPVASLQYWSRMWTVQEIILPRKLSVCYGCKAMPVRYLEAIYAFIGLQRISETGHDEFCATTLRKRRDFWSRLFEAKLPFHDFMSAFRKYECKERRDRIYALRSISKDFEVIPVDYTVNPATLLHSIMDSFPSTTTLSHGLDIFRALNLSVDQVLKATPDSVLGRPWTFRCEHYGIIRAAERRISRGKLVEGWSLADTYGQRSWSEQLKWDAVGLREKERFDDSEKCPMIKDGDVWVCPADDFLLIFRETGGTDDDQGQDSTTIEPDRSLPQEYMTSLYSGASRNLRVVSALNIRGKGESEWVCQGAFRGSRFLSKGFLIGYSDLTLSWTDLVIAWGCLEQMNYEVRDDITESIDLPYYPIGKNFFSLGGGLVRRSEAV